MSSIHDRLENVENLVKSDIRQYKRLVLTSMKSLENGKTKLAKQQLEMLVQMFEDELND